MIHIASVSTESGIKEALQSVKNYRNPIAVAKFRVKSDVKVVGQIGKTSDNFQGFQNSLYTNSKTMTFKSGSNFFGLLEPQQDIANPNAQKAVIVYVSELGGVWVQFKSEEYKKLVSACDVRPSTVQDLFKQQDQNKKKLQEDAKRKIYEMERVVINNHLRVMSKDLKHLKAKESESSGIRVETGSFWHGGLPNIEVRTTEKWYQDGEKYEANIILDGISFSSGSIKSEEDMKIYMDAVNEAKNVYYHLFPAFLEDFNTLRMSDKYQTLLKQVWGI